MTERTAHEAETSAELILHYPVRSLDNELFLPAGTVLTPARLQEISSMRKSAGLQKCSLLNYGTVRKDILRFLEAPPYDTIFADEELLIGLLQVMELVELAAPVLETLDYFIRNDFYTYRHILMVFALSTLLARDLLPDYADQIREVATGPTHDIGKICVPPEILSKQTPLTKQERRFLEHHVAAGYVLLSYYYGDDCDLTARVARDHHERRNGSGYPRGIRMNDYAVEIIAVSDVYDALISPRPYRTASFENRTALEEITAMAERNEVNWEVVKALIAYNRRGRADAPGTVVSQQKRGTPPSGNVYGIVSDEDGRD